MSNYKFDDNLSTSSGMASRMSENSQSKTTAETSGDNKKGDVGSSLQESLQERLAQNETRAVFLLRLAVVLILFAAASAVSVVVYLIASSSEENEFITQYEGASQKAIAAFHNIVINKMGGMTSLAVAAIAHGVDHSKDWPFVSLSSFQERTSTARSLSGAMVISTHPFVSKVNRPEWERYIANEGGEWIRDGLEYQEEVGMEIDIGKFKGSDQSLQHPNGSYWERDTWPMYYIDQNGETFDEVGPGPYMPYSQISPVIPERFVNQNLARNNEVYEEATLSMRERKMVIGDLRNGPAGNTSSDNFQTVFYSSLLSANAGKQVAYDGDAISSIFVPIFDSFKKDREAVGVMMAEIRWGAYFENVLPPSIHGLTVVLTNECQGAYTYEINGPNVTFLGKGDLHELKFDNNEKTTSYEQLDSVADGTKYGLDVERDYCHIHLHLYPSQTFYEAYITNTPMIITFSVATVFIFTIMMFIVYDRLVERRQKIVLDRAEKTTAIVTSLFPKKVTDKLLQAEAENKLSSTNRRLKSFLTDKNGQSDLDSEPLAELYPNCTVLFADIAGFTAWSSTREPAHVFHLLQNVYQAFDSIAKRRKVFKVETIGDCYVAVTGLPDYQENHALIMARFARDCMQKLYDVTRDLEVTLGPDTGDLAMRVGLHSGPVTAGVLKGERARFQLFGDTVNTASRMESTGVKHKIQVSESTAQLLMAAGKTQWVTQREDAVQAKGKGTMTTFWLNITTRKVGSNNGSDSNASTNNLLAELVPQKNLKHDRLVDWVTEIISDYIKKLIVLRKGSKRTFSAQDLVYRKNDDRTHIDELSEVIFIPEFDAKVAKGILNNQNDDGEVDAVVRAELRKYIYTLSAAYHDNPFHNFEHACHVTMSVSKLLNRIVTPDLDKTQANGKEGLMSQLYDYTYGINSDPMAQLAIMFSAIIHDVDHRGVSNAQLAIEEKSMAALYRNQSIAEQNSIDVAWDILMSDQFGKLRQCLFCSRDDTMRFYQVLVNVVLATDIFDKDLNDLRKKRWNKAFHDDTVPKDEVDDLRATIVIEHIMQASDVAHTMQHWHVYRKWNQRLFAEMRKAYKNGRMKADPASFWYKGELGFFDNYIIPLANKLKQCNVFGVSSDEYLNYAVRNRAEWAERGEEILEEMLQEEAKVNKLMEKSKKAKADNTV